MKIFAGRAVLCRVPRCIGVIGLYAFLALPQILFAQYSLFVTRSGSNLSLNNRPFYAIGTNSYFLQNLAAYGDTSHITQLLQTAQGLGVTAIRTWGFFDSPDSANPAVVQYRPGKFNENALLALDYVVAKAKELSVRIIIPLVNNWEDDGGMNQYVQWYADLFPSMTKRNSAVMQRMVLGTGGRKYKFLVAGSFTHDDFYTNPTIKQWYKNYILMLLGRTNTITHTFYKDEPAILAWELANEPRSSDPTGEIVTNWLTEMSAFIKSIDTNHLVSSGEEGLDTSPTSYSSTGSYSGQGWLFDGSGGVSFSQNLQISNLDVASVHCYPESWGLKPGEGITWLRDHQRLADEAQKPLVVGEVGMRRQAQLFYEAAFNEAYYGNTAGVLLWQLDFGNSPYSDAFAFSCHSDTSICGVIKNYAEQFEQKSNGASVIPLSTLLLQNYPNPFNLTTVISYELSSRNRVQLVVYNILGQRVESLVDDEQEAGYHATFFDAGPYGSGSYFVRLGVGSISRTQRIMLIK